GVRDLSLIETPPLDRLPVETIVTGFSRGIIKDAIERELARGGQVFFVHNRVQSLPAMTAFVQSLCPEARVAMAHGQMAERELGSGFRLAMRDLEIRGTGNLLGAAQHGHIAAVGFDLYTKLLADAVRELKGEPSSAHAEPVIAVDVEALLPETYVPEVNQRLALYKRLAEVDGREEIEQMRAELADRFGPLPPAVETLLEVVARRGPARKLGLERSEPRGG